MGNNSVVSALSAWPPFSSDEFLDTVRDVYMPGARKRVVECEGIHVRTLVGARNRAVSRFFPFPFMLEHVEPEPGAPPLAVAMLYDVVVAESRLRELGPPGAGVAPFVRWSEFGSWQDFLRRSMSLPGVDSPQTVVHKTRQLERALGTLDFQLVDDSSDVFETLLRWKSNQYRRTGGVDRLSIRQNIDFYWEMRRRGLFTATSLRAGGRLVAGKIGYRAGKRHIAQLTVYDPEVGKFSPGAVAELMTLRASYEAGDDEFDYQPGSQPYKFTHATHVRWTVTLGKEPFPARVDRVVRARVGRALRNRKAYVVYKEAVRRTAQRARAIRGWR